MFWFLKFAASGHEYLNSLIKKKIRELKFWLLGLTGVNRTRLQHGTDSCDGAEERAALSASRYVNIVANGTVM